MTGTGSAGPVHLGVLMLAHDFVDLWPDDTVLLRLPLRALVVQFVIYVPQYNNLHIGLSSMCLSTTLHEPDCYWYSLDSS